MLVAAPGKFYLNDVTGVTSGGEIWQVNMYGPLELSTCV